MVDPASVSDIDFELESPRTSSVQRTGRTRERDQITSPDIAFSSQTLPFEISSSLQHSTPPASVLSNNSQDERYPVVSSGNAESNLPFQIPRHLLNKSFAQEPSYFERPNRYFGPASTWRSWTEVERGIADAIEREKAMNLSRHLYNSHALKRNAKFPDLQLPSKRIDAHRGRKRSEKGKELAEESEVKITDSETSVNMMTRFEPPRVWTAWPLPKDEVPREKLLPDIHLGSLRMPRDQRPSAPLENCLLALTTKFARLRWELREDEDNFSAENQSPVQSSSPYQQAEKVEDQEDSMDGAYAEERFDVDDSMQDPSVGTTSPHIQLSQEVSSSSEEESQFPRPMMFSSQMFNSSTTSSSSSQDLDCNVDKPDFTVDDDKVYQLLLPSVRHTISRLDEILMAAHRSRQLYARGTGRSRSRSRSQSARQGTLRADGDTQSPVLRPDLETDGIEPGSRSPRKNKRETDDTTQSTSRTRSEPLNPHDWSSIIGLASIVKAFEPNTITRASERCARLFGENMLFRTFHETEENPSFTEVGTLFSENTKQNGKGRSPWFEERFIIDDEANELDDEIEQTDEELMTERGNVHFKRVSEACVQCRQAKSKCEPPPTSGIREQPLGSVVCERCLQTAQTCSKIEIESALQPMFEIKMTLRCPHEDCERHSIPFQKHGNLKRHITLVHAGEIPLHFPREVSRKRSFSSMQERSPDVGNLPYFCPVEKCPRSTNGSGGPFQVGSRLYTHLRKAHPEVDVDMIKRLELQKRGERRGRWSDKRRHRSRSQAGISQERANVTPEDGGNDE